MSDRAEFEKWQSEEKGRFEFGRYEFGSYVDDAVEDDWRVWQAARHAPASGEVEQAYMQGQVDAGIDPSFSNAKAYAESVGCTHPPAKVPEVPTEEMLDAGVTALIRGLKTFKGNYTQVVNNIWEDMAAALLTNPTPAATAEQDSDSVRGVPRCQQCGNMEPFHATGCAQTYGEFTATAPAKVPEDVIAAARGYLLSDGPYDWSSVDRAHAVKTLANRGLLATAPSQAVLEIPKGENDFGLDARYFHEKLRLILRDIGSYTPTEMARALGRLAITADSETMREPEFNISGLIDEPKYREGGHSSQAVRSGVPEGWKIRRMPYDTWEAGKIHVISPGDHHCMLERIPQAPAHHPMNMFYGLAEAFLSDSNAPSEQGAE